ncbi:sterol desaturase family protein [Dawidia cretensis]|uniref:sterol desaturase family protein n=1 Tax=Dawidia cretensis TaxID=2782350 RepID=UPI0020B352D5|nr:sterol desaturase family protein [Dawidia cretensis]
MSADFWTTLNFAALAIPAFFIFTGLEYAAALRQKKPHLFKFDSSVANISIGVAERLLNLFLTASFYGLFQYVYTHFALWSIPNTWWVWVIMLLATDLVWYWYHRLGHEINLFWAAHIVHHQSEEFNYTVSARITTLQALIRNLFWCVLPLAGFHPDMIIATLIIHGTYSFFTHTQIIGKLGWLEYILITPSHHRVHHASNEKYLNKNYGDLFVFWDKLFGTFQREEEAPTYGLTHPLKSYSFIWQHVHYFLELGLAVRRTPGFLRKLKIIFGNPELLDQNLRAELEQKFLPHKEETTPRIRHKAYVLIQVVLVIIIAFIVTLFYWHLDTPDVLTGILFVAITLINCGALLEQRHWIYYLEQVRLVLLAGYLAYAFDQPVCLAAGVIVSTLTLWPAWPARKWFLEFIYG